MHPKDESCFFIGKKKLCIKDDDPVTRTAFDESKLHVLDRFEKIRFTQPFRLEKNCNMQGNECFKRNIRNSGIFVILFLIASFILNFLHELVHYSFIVLLGITDVELVFSVIGGKTLAELPPMGDPSVPWWWWYMGLMGPMLLINFPSVIIPMLLVDHDDKNPPFIERTKSQTGRWLWKNFLKAIAYSSAFIILANTIFSPLYSIAFSFLGVQRPYSDSELFWMSISYMESPFIMINVVLYIITISFFVTFVIVFIMLYNRREMGN